jgi:GTPase SAR1 family protein
MDNDAVPFILVGNKANLGHWRQVESSHAEALAKQWNCPYIETSAKTKDNVQLAYQTLLKLYSHNYLFQTRTSTTLRFPLIPPREKSALLHQTSKSLPPMYGLFQ